MPLKGERNREYMREYMRRKRAAERTGTPKHKAAPAQPAGPDHGVLVRELAQARARIAELEAETTKLKMRCGELQMKCGELLRTRGVMSFQTLSALSKALHPDYKPSEAERERAFKLFTAWKAGKDKTRPRARG